MLDQNAPGAFAVTSYPDGAALRDAIRNRDVYGGISPGGLRPADHPGGHVAGAGPGAAARQSAVGAEQRARIAATGLGTLGQYLPQGANATLLRSTAFFGGAGGGAAVAVLTCWAVAGVVPIVIAGLRRRA
jgi:hypothetical protein